MPLATGDATAISVSRRPWKLCWGPRVQLVFDFVAMVLLLILDLRDFHFKTNWLGPSASYPFTAVQMQTTQQSSPLVAPQNYTFAGQRVSRFSGWNSFLEKCEELVPITSSPSSTSFAHVLAKNCEIGRPSNSHVVPALIAVANVRVDSIVWAACKLLYHNRKPMLCHGPMVTRFTQRYHMRDAPSLLTFGARDNKTLSTVDVDTQSHHEYAAVPGSDAEAELLQLLMVIAKSTPIHKVVCVEGFVYDGPGHYTAQVFGCGSPNYYASAFVGLHATSFPQFHQNKAWLTTDELELMGFKYSIRQNSRSLFTVLSTPDDTTTLTLEHRMLVNISSYGELYYLMLLIDLVLIVLSARTCIEIVRLMMWPQWLELAAGQAVRAGHSPSFGALDDYEAVLTSALYRSKPVVMLIGFSQVVAWLFVVPNVVIWTTTESPWGKCHALLTVIRAWVLILVVFNTLWDFCVAVAERKALVFARSTHVTVVEVGIIASLIAWIRQRSIWSIAETKYTAEHQRLVDTTAFQGPLQAVANTFPNAMQDAMLSQSTRLLFGPLMAIVGWSVFCIALFACVRCAYLRYRHPELSKLENPFQVLLTLKRRSQYKPLVQPADETLPSNTRTSPSKTELLRLLPPPPPSPTRQKPLAKHALRLAIEDLVDVPIRARSLVRSSLYMEKKIGQHYFLRPPYYLEHGVILDEDGKIMTRDGFVGIVKPVIDLRQELQLLATSPRRPNTNASTTTTNASPPHRTSRTTHSHRRKTLAPLR